MGAVLLVFFSVRRARVFEFWSIEVFAKKEKTHNSGKKRGSCREKAGGSSSCVLEFLSKIT